MYTSIYFGARCAALFGIKAKGLVLLQKQRSNSMMHSLSKQEIEICIFGNSGYADDSGGDDDDKDVG